MKTYFILGSILLSINSYAQVGINTASPQATLDVTSSGSTTTTKDGVIAPKLTKQQLASKVTGTYSATQSGAIIYVTDITTPTGTTPSLAQTVEVTAIGYYFFNGTLWKNMNSNSANIYNTNGSLNSNRVVTQAANTLSFTGNVVNSFSVDGTTLSVDAANDRVGIGTASPTNKLHVNATNPIRLQGTTSGDPNTDRPVVLDANGVLKTINTLEVLGIPNPAIFRLQSNQSNFLNGVAAGSSQTVPMTLIKNTINGLSYSDSTSTLTMPPGNYQMVFVYEATHDITGCTLSSYIVDFPLNLSESQRIHSTSSHNTGALSNHGGTVTFTTQITGTRSWTIRLGRGQSGNCSGTGMTLLQRSTHLLVFRIGDV